MDDHALRSECATNFGKLSAEIKGLRDQDGVSRDEFRILRESITNNHANIMTALSMVREDVSALKVKASIWGALGGALMALITAALALATSAFR